MSNVIDEARGLKSEAMDARDDGEFEEAVELIEKAERLLRDALDELKQNREDGKEPGRFEVDIASQLVHILGSRGGILRRSKAYDGSICAYDVGYEEFERPGAGYGIVNSYNLVQRLVSRIFKEPDCLHDGSPAVNGLFVRGELSNALEEIQRQRSGKRAEDEYAAADLALVCLLLGKEDWGAALDDFVNSSPPPQPYAIEVTRELIDELREAMKESPSAPDNLVERLSVAHDKLSLPPTSR